MGGFRSTTGAAIMAERPSPVKAAKSKPGGLRPRHVGSERIWPTVPGYRFLKRAKPNAISGEPLARPGSADEPSGWS
jgi:hypothetical protein